VRRDEGIYMNWRYIHNGCVYIYIYNMRYQRDSRECKGYVMKYSEMEDSLVFGICWDNKRDLLESASTWNI
jgi:hypothetical protein